MKLECEQARKTLLDLGWTTEERRAAAAAAAQQHLESCEECRRAAAEYEAFRAAIPHGNTVEPAGGWDAFEARLLTAARGRRRRRGWPLAIAAGLVGGITVLNGWMMVRQSPAREAPATVAVKTVMPAALSSDMADSSMVKAFRTVSHAFDGRADWVMVSDESCELGLGADHPAGEGLLVLRLVLKQGDGAASQMHFAIVPGATVRVTVPSAGGEQVQYVISTDAAAAQDVAVWMAVGASGHSQGAQDLGSMATSLHMNYGEAMPAGSVVTQRGRFDLSMTLDRAPGKGA